MQFFLLAFVGRHFDRTLTDAASTFRLRPGSLAVFCWPLLDVISTGLRRTPSPRFAFGQACLQPSNFLSHARHQTHHTARHFGIVDTLLLLHDNLHHTKTTHAHLHLLACRIPSGRCWARVVNSPVVPLDQHGHGRKSLMFRVTLDRNWAFSTSCRQFHRITLFDTTSRDRVFSTSCGQLR